MIPLNDLSHLLAQQRELTDQAIKRVLDSAWLVLGPELEIFERDFAEFCSSECCIGVANGTDALEIALRSAGADSSSAIATAANAGAYTSTAIQAIGAKISYLDVDINSRCLTADCVQQAISNGVEIVVVTHLYGLVTPEIQKIAAICKQKNIVLIEDCAQAHGASLSSGIVGSFGDIGTFSFYPTKNLGALGDGGAIVTSNALMASKARQLRQYGWSDKYQITERGGRNSRLDELQAAVLGAKLSELHANNRTRLASALYYSKYIQNPHIRLPLIPEQHGNMPYVAHLYVILCSQRDALRTHLNSASIASDVHYPVPDHLQTVAFAKNNEFNLENTEQLARECLTLPLFVGIKQSQQDHIISTINAFKP